MWHHPYDRGAQHVQFEKQEKAQFAGPGKGMEADLNYWQGPSPGKQQPNNQKTLLWQQDQYLVDSGINSGQSTQAPSEYGLEEHAESPVMAPSEELVCSPRKNTPQSEVAPYMGYNQPGAQPQQQLAPEPQMSSGQQMFYPENMIEPSELLQQAVVNLMSYQEDADLTCSAVPELLHLINDDDPVVRGSACSMVFQLSRRDQCHRSLVSSPQMVAALVQILCHAPDAETMRHATGTLHNLSNFEQGLRTIFKYGGVPALVNLLGYTTEAVLFYSITTLHNLLLHQEGTKAQIRSAGGVQRMVGLLSKQHVKFLAILTDCLRLLAYQHQETKLTILASGGVEALIYIMQTCNYEKLLWTTTRVLKVLSVCPKNKMAIIENGGFQALGQHLLANSKRLVLNCCLTLRNLSDIGSKNENIQPLLENLLLLLGCNDVEIIVCALGCLANLTCNNPANKLAVFEHRGIEALVKTINTAAGKDDLIEPAVRTLKHITRQHAGAEMARTTVFMQQDLPDFVKKCI